MPTACWPQLWPRADAAAVQHGVDHRSDRAERHRRADRGRSGHVAQAGAVVDGAGGDVLRAGEQRSECRGGEQQSHEAVEQVRPETRSESGEVRSCPCRGVGGVTGRRGRGGGGGGGIVFMLRN